MSHRLIETAQKGDLWHNMSGVDRVEKKNKKLTGESTDRNVRKMPAGQVFWGAMMVLSLFVMLAAGFPAARAAADGKREQETTEAVSRKRKENLYIFLKNMGEKLRFATESSKTSAAAGMELKENMAGKSENGTDIRGDKEKADGGNTEWEDGAPVIAFTFDDGPFTTVTNRILDVLTEYGAGATFFVVGSRLDMYSDTLKRIYEEGFEIGSHTWSHKNLNNLTAEEITKEINDTTERLKMYVPVEKALLRPPYGNADENVRSMAGTALINWSLDSEDWKSRDADAIVRHVLDTVKDGDIILMHDLYESTAEAVEILVPELVKRGYRIVSVTELFECKKILLQEGILYRNPKDSY